MDPPEEIGETPAVWAVAVIAVTRAVAVTFVVPIFASNGAMVGIRVGITTPDVELNQLITPSVTPRRGIVVDSVMIEDKPFANKSIPPEIITIFIKTLIPQTRSKVPQGIPAMAFFWSAVFNNKRITEATKEVKPTSNLKANTQIATQRIATQLSFCSFVIFGMSDNFKGLSALILYPFNTMYNTMANVVLQRNWPIIRPVPIYSVIPFSDASVAPKIPVVFSGVVPPP